MASERRDYKVLICPPTAPGIGLVYSLGPALARGWGPPRVGAFVDQDWDRQRNRLKKAGCGAEARGWDPFPCDYLCLDVAVAKSKSLVTLTARSASSCMVRVRHDARQRVRPGETIITCATTQIPVSVRSTPRVNRVGSLVRRRDGSPAQIAYLGQRSKGTSLKMSCSDIGGMIGHGFADSKRGECGAASCLDVEEATHMAKLGARKLPRPCGPVCWRGLGHGLRWCFHFCRAECIQGTRASGETCAPRGRTRLFPRDFTFTRRGLSQLSSPATPLRKNTTSIDLREFAKPPPVARY
jgi:hypothetical protein